LPDAGQIARVVVRLALAAVLGGRVALGSAFFILASQRLGVPAADMSRVVQGVVTGIGFIGAGAILKLGEQGQVRGLTTAASIWMAAGIGLAAGLGREMLAILGTLLTLTVLAVLPRMARPFNRAGPSESP
jgi:putative Mg2+ transporter-C (MgtC) family protein